MIWPTNLEEWFSYWIFGLVFYMALKRARDSLSEDPVLNKIRQVVFSIFEKGKLLKIPHLYNICVREMEETPRRIWSGIYTLIDERVIVPKSYLGKDNVLENDRRREILEYIIERAGAHQQEVIDALDLTPALCKWHLNMLEKFNVIYSYTHKNRVIYFSHEVPADLRAIIATMRQEIPLQVVGLLLRGMANPSRGGFSTSELVRELDLPRTTLQYHLQDCQQAGILTKEKEGRRNCYRFSPKFVKKLGRIEEIAPRYLKGLPTA